MKVEGMKEIILRSETLHNVKYINYIGDGDQQWYVQKIMCSRLCAIEKRTKEGKTLGGKGRLTDKLIHN